MGTLPEQNAGATVMSLQIGHIAHWSHMSDQVTAYWKRCLHVSCSVNAFPHVAVCECAANVCESALYNTCVFCAWLYVCVCVSLSVFGPLKGSCRAEGEEKITGADIICFCHVDSTSESTQCGPVQRGRKVDVPAHMLWDACMVMLACFRAGVMHVHTIKSKKPHSKSRKQGRGFNLNRCFPFLYSAAGFLNIFK